MNWTKHHEKIKIATDLSLLSTLQPSFASSSDWTMSKEPGSLMFCSRISMNSSNVSSCLRECSFFVITTHLFLNLVWSITSWIAWSRVQENRYRFFQIPFKVFMNFQAKIVQSINGLQWFSRYLKQLIIFQSLWERASYFVSYKFMIVSCNLEAKCKYHSWVEVGSL